jgi:hypothetical protein
MANIDGAWNCTVSSPMGPQLLTLTITTDGDRFTGTATGPLGSLDLENGAVAGDAISFKLQLKIPMPMALDGQATVSGDTLTGTVTAGAFGAWPITGTRA